MALALASLLIFPQVFLRSMGFGGMAAVLVAMLAALTVLPALLAVLGSADQRAAGPPVAADGDLQGDGAWARIAHSVMRRPVLVRASASVPCWCCSPLPFLRVQWGGFDERVLPAGTEPRTVAERIRTEFPAGSVGPIDVLVSRRRAGRGRSEVAAAGHGRCPA